MAPTGAAFGRVIIPLANRSLFEMVVKPLDDGRGFIFNCLYFSKSLVQEGIKVDQASFKASQRFTSGLHYNILGHGIITGRLPLLVGDALELAKPFENESNVGFDLRSLLSQVFRFLVKPRNLFLDELFGLLQRQLEVEAETDVDENF